MDLEELINRNKLLEEENKELKEKLKKYTAPARNRAFYEKHKQELLAKNKEYIVSPEKKKQYARTAWILTQIKQRNRKIVQYTIEGKVINTFDSCTEAEKSTGVSRSGITHCCLGNHKTAKGYIWKYESIV